MRQREMMRSGKKVRGRREQRMVTATILMVAILIVGK